MSGDAYFSSPLVLTSLARDLSLVLGHGSARRWVRIALPLCLVKKSSIAHHMCYRAGSRPDFVANSYSDIILPTMLPTPTPRPRSFLLPYIYEGAGGGYTDLGSAVAAPGTVPSTREPWGYFCLPSAKVRSIFYVVRTRALLVQSY